MLAQAFEPRQWLIAAQTGPFFYQAIGWKNPEELFGTLGEHVVMIVDVDHNDSDDRLAIILLAFLIASANAHRRQARPDAADAWCSLLLDARTYESSGLCLWRTAALGARLNRTLSPCGLRVELIVGDAARALEHVAQYLGAESTQAAIDKRVAGAGELLGNGRPTLPSALWGRPVVSVWVLGGLCAQQVDDLQHALEASSVRLSFCEQAQPAWQSMGPQASTGTPAAAVQSAADTALLLAHGFGAEPSNIRSSARPYPETLAVYMRLQQLVETHSGRVSWSSLGLAREDGYMPVPPGQPMVPVRARPFTVKTGAVYAVTKAVDPAKVQAAFAALLASAKRHLPETLLVELCIDTSDEQGDPRLEMRWVAECGTYMADGITVCVLARPRPSETPFCRRLAVLRFP